MSEVNSVVIQSADAAPTGEAVEQALAEAAANAPTSTEEAAAKLAAEREQSERPEWLNEKFKSPEDLAKAYAELEAKLGAAPEEAAEANAEETPKEEDTSEEKEEDVAAKVDVSTFEAEYAEKGELSEESYAKLESIGFSRETVDAYKRGQEALAQIATQRLTDAAGGEEELSRVLTWAKTGLTPEQVDKANEIFGSNDIEAAVLKMEEVRGLYSKATGADPQKRLEGNPSTRVEGYGSWAEVTRDMSNPKYKTDKAFQAKVANKLAASSI